MSDAPVLSVDDAARRLGKARQAHERAPDDEQKYQALLEAQIAYGRAREAQLVQEIADEKSGNRALRQQLQTTRADLDRARDAKVDAMRAAVRAAKPKKGKPKALPMLDLISQPTPKEI